jgi:hypothetical protein
MRRYKSDMLGFIYGKCEAAKDARKFVNDWIRTDKNPCSVCSYDKSQCTYFKTLMEVGVINGDQTPS